MTAVQAPLVEIFASLQGEGRYVGQPQTFLRLGSCPVRCRYCDTPEGLTAPAEYVLRLLDGQVRGPNPIGVAGALDLVERCDRDVGTVRPLSLTGGEPLVHPRFLAALLERVDPARRIHLETAGIHAEALRSLAGRIDHVSMDWKLDATMERGGLAERHCDFLRSAVSGCGDVCVKIVLTAAVALGEFLHALDEILAIDASVPVFLQPVTPARQIAEDVPPELVDRCVAAAETRGAAVRVQPQLHKILGRR